VYTFLRHLKKPSSYTVKNRAIKTYGGVGIQFRIDVGNEWPTSRPGRIVSRERDRCRRVGGSQIRSGHRGEEESLLPAGNRIMVTQPAFPRCGFLV
jgi:hypothetical protein